MFKNTILLPLLFLFFNGNAQDTITCPIKFHDTLKYVLSKTNYDVYNNNNSFTLISINNINDGGSYGYSGYGQYYAAPEPVKIIGAKFFGTINSGPLDSIWVKLYNMNAGMPDTVIDSVYTRFNSYGSTNGYYSATLSNEVLFPTQPVINSGYMLAVENHSSHDYYITRTDTTLGNGAGEAFTYYEGVTDHQYDGWYNAYSFGAAWDFDFALEPIVEYSGTLTSITNPDTLCYGDTLFYQNTFVMNDTAIFNSKFYNPDSLNFANSFSVYIAPQFNFGVNYSVLSDTSLVVLDTGAQDLSFYVTLDSVTWTWPWGMGASGCLHSISQYPDMNQVTASDTLCLNQTATLYPGMFDSYQWSSGQLTDSIQVGTFLQADSLYFSVMVTKGNCSGQYGYPIIVDNCLGIEENEITFEVYPNPANSEFTINGNFESGATIKLINLLGEVVYSNTLYSNLEIVDVSRLPVGLYTLSLTSGNRNLTKKIQIVK